MQSLGAICEEGEHAVKRLKVLRTATPSMSSSKEEAQRSHSEVEEKHSKFNLFEELQKLYDEEETNSISSDNENENVLYKSLLLEKLVSRERLNTIIFNLYPGNKGYSIAFRAQDRTMCIQEGSEEMIETKTWPYEDGDLLAYLDREELPPIMTDILEQFEYLYYSGCVIAEIRDYRLAYRQHKCCIHHVLLRPTQKTLLADINNLTKDKSDVTIEDKDALESQILLASTPDLCLEPDNHIENDLAEIYSRKHLWNTSPLRKIAKKFTQTTVNRKRKLDQHTHMHDLELFEFSKAKQRKSESSHSSRTLLRKATSEEHKTGISIPNLDCSSIGPPNQPVTVNGFKPMKWPEETNDCSLQLMEEYILETDMPSKDKDNPRVYHIKLSIFQRPSNFEFLGELYLDRDHKKGEGKGVSCRFSLGSRPNVHRYVQQFTEIFTECGRKVARIRGGSARSDAHAATRSAAQSQHNQEQTERLRQDLQTQSQQVTLQAGVNGVSQTIPIQIPHDSQSGNVQQKPHQFSTKELEINALAKKLMNSAQQFQAAANAKQQAAQQQKFLANSNIISLLNSSPVNASNNEASAAVVNALNNTSATHQRLLSRKMTLSNVPGCARVLNHSNLIALSNSRVNLSDANAQLNPLAGQTVTLTSVNNNRVSLSEFNSQASGQQPQTVTLTSAGTGGNYNYTTVPIKHQVKVVNQRILNTSSSEGNNKSLSALLVGTPAADVPDVVGPNTNSVLLEKLASSSGQSIFTQAPKSTQQTQFVVQNAKGNTVISPSPPPQTSGTLNVQSLNLAQLQSIPGFQNVVQIPGSAQLISLALNVSGQVSSGNGTPTGLLVSLPAGVATQTQAVATQSSQQAVQGVVLNTAGPSQVAHIVSSGNIKNLSQQNLRLNSGSQTVQLTQGGSQFQLFSQIQRPNRQQNLPNQANITTRTIQRTPITIKMAPNSNPRTLETMQHYQQICVNQQKNLGATFEKIRKPNGESS
ncbi:transcription factor Spt20 homolog [Rhynchophorus ferrugineus]|uniref:transcription factor Spt20 homolog n=1 Tax=Rhynchophorus ferrugineus TaxID=354439 RepID=UPI003FCD0E2B